MEGRPSLRRQIIWALPALIVVSAVGALLWTRQAARSRQGTSDGRPLEGLGIFGQVPEFSLVERSGEKIGLADLLGKVWIANFIYTNCPDTCPVQSGQIKALQEEFAGEKDLRLVSITVDPKRDTPKALSEYAGRFGADPQRWIFLTGEREEIYRLAREGFRLGAAEIPAEKREESGATHAHSPRFVLIDRKAQIRGYYPGTDQEALARLRRDLVTLLRGAG